MSDWPTRIRLWLDEYTHIDYERSVGVKALEDNGYVVTEARLLLLWEELQRYWKSAKACCDACVMIDALPMLVERAMRKEHRHQERVDVIAAWLKEHLPNNSGVEIVLRDCGFGEIANALEGKDRYGQERE